MYQDNSGDKQRQEQQPQDSHGGDMLHLQSLLQGAAIGDHSPDSGAPRRSTCTDHARLLETPVGGSADEPSACSIVCDSVVECSERQEWSETSQPSAGHIHASKLRDDPDGGNTDEPLTCRTLREGVVERCEQQEWSETSQPSTGDIHAHASKLLEDPDEGSTCWPSRWTTERESAVESRMQRKSPETLSTLRQDCIDGGCHQQRLSESLPRSADDAQASKLSEDTAGESTLSSTTVDETAMKCIEERESPQGLSTSRQDCIDGGSHQQRLSEYLPRSADDAQASKLSEDTAGESTLSLTTVDETAMECIEERESPQELSTSRHEDWTCIVGGNEQQDSPETLSTSTENTQASSILERTVHTVSELLLPYLALDDIQALSLVSRRFNRLFQNDGYLRRFLQMSLGLRPDSIPTGGGRHAMFAMLTAEARSLAGMLRCGGIEEDEGHKSRTCYMDLNVLRENPLFDVPLFLLKTSSWYTFTRLTFHDIQNAFGLNPTLDVFRDSTFLPMNDLQLSLDGGATIRPSTIFEHYRGRLRQGTIELYQSGLTTSNPFNQLKYNVSDIGAMSRRRKFESDADYRLALLTNIREHFDTIEPQQKRLLSCYRRFLKVLASWHQAEFVTIPELKSVGVGSPYLMGLYAAQMLPRTFQPAMQHCVNTHPALVDYIEGDLFISPITYIQACFVFEIRTPSVQAKDSAARKAVYLKIGEYLKLQQSQGVFFSVQELANVMIRFLDNN